MVCIVAALQAGKNPAIVPAKISTITVEILLSYMDIIPITVHVYYACVYAWSPNTTVQSNNIALWLLWKCVLMHEFQLLPKI